jgi:hypothetical protein
VLEALGDRREAVAERSNQAAPMPRIARPPLSTSIVVVCLARNAGLR